ncbi:hypothetical protein CR513_32542, partial [Mucuna pruriens]
IPNQNAGGDSSLGRIDFGLPLKFSLFASSQNWLRQGDMKRTFLDKFFPTSKTTSIKKEICGELQQIVCNLSLSSNYEQLLIQYFYEGLMLIDRSMFNVTSGEALMDKTLAISRNLISNIAGNKIIELTSLIRQLFQQNVTTTILELQTQIGQLATIVNQLQQNGFA